MYSLSRSVSPELADTGSLDSRSCCRYCSAPHPRNSLRQREEEVAAFFTNGRNRVSPPHPEGAACRFATMTAKFSAAQRLSRRNSPSLNRCGFHRIDGGGWESAPPPLAGARRSISFEVSQATRLPPAAAYRWRSQGRFYPCCPES